MLAPFAEAPDGYWVRFVARLHEDPRFNPWAGREPYGAAAEVMAASQEITKRLREALTLSEQEANTRFYLVTTMAVHAVADRHALAAGEALTSLPSPAKLLDPLVEAAVAILTR